MTADDIAIIGAGPGGLACALKAVELGLSYILLEKGQNAFQGIIDSYPRGKKCIRRFPKEIPALFLSKNSCRTKTTNRWKITL